MALLLPALLCGFALETSTLPVVNVVDSEPDGDFDQTDINAAVTACATPCRLVFPDDWFEDVAWTVTSANVKRIENAHLQAPVPIKNNVLQLSSVSGVVVTNPHIDGQKDIQPKDCSKGGEPCTAVADGIDVANSTDIRISGGRIFDIQHGQGIHVLGTSDDVMIHGTLVEDIGCHEIDTPCPVSDPAGCVDCNQPNRNTTGVGIEFASASSTGVVSGVIVRKATKMGIQAFSSSTMEIRDSRVYDSMTGMAANNGGVFHVYDSEVWDAGMTGHVGAGISYSAKNGAGHTLSGNASYRAGASAYSIDTAAGNGTTLTNNSADASCQDATDSDYRAASGSGSPYPTGPTLTGDTATNSLCEYGVEINAWDAAVLDGGSFSGAFLYGVRFDSSTDPVLQGSPTFTCSGGTCTAAVNLTADTTGETVGSFTNNGFGQDTLDEGA